jgi:hypothetical protein
LNYGKAISDQRFFDVPCIWKHYTNDEFQLLYVFPVASDTWCISVDKAQQPPKEKSYPTKFHIKPMFLCFIIVNRSHIVSDEKHKWTVGQYERTKGVAMRSEPKFEIMYVDPLKNRMALLKGRDFADQLDNLKSAIEYMLKKMEKLGDYELSEFTAKAGVEAGFWVLKANGSIEMKWTKAKKQ